jgi:hypothetical protein
MKENKIHLKSRNDKISADLNEIAWYGSKKKDPLSSMNNILDEYKLT